MEEDGSSSNDSEQPTDSDDERTITKRVAKARRKPKKNKYNFSGGPPSWFKASVRKKETSWAFVATNLHVQVMHVLPFGRKDKHAAEA